MTSPESLVKEFETTPFDLYNLRGKEFTIVENIDRKAGNFREVREMNKWDKPQVFFFIRIENALFQKDLKLAKHELQNLLITVPPSIPNLQGVMMSVDLGKGAKYMGNATQDMNGNKLGSYTQAPGQTAPPVVNNSTSDLEKLVADVRKLTSVGVPVDTKVLTSLCDGINPGHALELIKSGKDAGYICEVKPGVYTAP